MEELLLNDFLPFIKGNVAFILTNCSYKEIKEKLRSRDAARAVKVGMIAPNDVELLPGNTWTPPTFTSFFQAVGCITYISRGTVEIPYGHQLIKKGEKITELQEKICNELKMKPFRMGAKIKAVFNKGIFEHPDLLDRTDSDWIRGFLVGVRNVASISVSLGEVNAASSRYWMHVGLNNVIAVALECNFSIAVLDRLKPVKIDITTDIPKEKDKKSSDFVMGSLFD